MKEYTFINFDKTADDGKSLKKQYDIHVKTPMPDTTVGELINKIPDFGGEYVYKIILSEEDDGNGQDLIVTVYKNLHRKTDE